jgi:hypothetical protein
VYNLSRFVGTGPVTFLPRLLVDEWEGLPGLSTPNRAIAIASRSVLDITCSGGLRIGLPPPWSPNSTPSPPIIEISMTVYGTDPNTGSGYRIPVVTYLQGDTELNQTLRWNMGTVLEVAPGFASISVMARALPVLDPYGSAIPVVTVSGDGSAADTYQLQAVVTIAQISQ